MSNSEFLGIRVASPRAVGSLKNTRRSKRRRRIGRVDLLVAALAASAFAVYLNGFYTGGDVRHYLRSYETINSLPLIPAYEQYGRIVGAAEPIYFLVSYAFAQTGASYELYKIVLNTALAVATTTYLRKNRVSLFVCFLFIGTNFYLLALFTEAERLGLAIFFSIMGLIAYSDRRRLCASLLLTASVLSHFQMMLPFAAVLTARLFSPVLNRFDHLQTLKLSPGWINLAVALILAGLAGPDLIASSQRVISSKLSFYAENMNVGLDNLRQAAILMPILIVLSRQVSKDIFIYLLIAIPAIFIGEERINIILILFYFTVVLREERWMHPLNLALLAYFSAKGILFLSVAMQYGTGY